jgi:iron-sulfur cluster assembly accessory protein
MITVTESALSQLSVVADKNNAPVVRYELRGGGCGGLMSSWSVGLHHEPEQNEQTWPLGAERVFVIDEFTSEFIDGGTIDYDTTDFMPSFKIHVPDKGSCGCGDSFVA